jgi:hypothetical protein
MDRARQREEEGHRIAQLNIGNLAPFGFEPPEEEVMGRSARFCAAYRRGHGR